MKINRAIRLKVAERVAARLEKELKKCNPYGYKDCQLIYNDLMYWEDLVDELKTQ